MSSQRRRAEARVHTLCQQAQDTPEAQRVGVPNDLFLQISVVMSSAPSY